MLKDLIVSFQQNLKEKTRNPFLGTYLIVWLIRNWKLVFTVFNFDENFTLEKKIAWIENYYENGDFLWNLMINILWAFAVLIITYILLNFSRLIINGSEKIVTPYIYKITDSNSIVLKETYDRVVNDKYQVEEKLEKERENKLKLQNEISRLEIIIEDLFKEKATLEGKIENHKFDPNLNGESPFSTTNILNDYEQVQFDKIKKKDYLESFLNFVMSIQEKEGWLEKEFEDERVRYFLKLGLVKYGEIDDQFYNYILTKEGENVLKEVRLNID